MTARQFRVFVLDDIEIIRKGISFTIERADIEVVGAAAHDSTALERIFELSPDVVLMDLKSPHVTVVEAVRNIKLQNPQIRVLILTERLDIEVFQQVFNAGADGFCSKHSSVENMLQALNSTAAGGVWLDAQIADMVIGRLRGRREAVQPGTSNHFNEALSARELEVLHFVAHGLSNKEIAQKLGVGSETVKTHMRHIMEKMQVSDRTQAAVKALKDGVVQRIDEIA